MFGNEEIILMILGIGGSGRSEGINTKAIEFLLETTNKNYQYISLIDKKINDCIGCKRCAEDNICKQSDDWNEIGQKRLKQMLLFLGL